MLKALYRKANFDAKVLSLMHQLSINEHLISTNAISHSISWISGGGDLDLSPFLVGRHELTSCCAFFELLVYALLLDAAFPLNQWRCCTKSAKPIMYKLGR